MTKARHSIFLILLYCSAYSFTASAEEAISFKYKNNTSLTFTEKTFIKSEYNITYCKESICLIDDQPLWGSDAKLPKTILSNIVFNNGKNKIELDTSSMFDPLINKQSKHRFKVSHYYADTWKIKGEFSDGAGTYYAEWLVTKQGSVRVLIGDSELLYDALDSLFK